MTFQISDARPRLAEVAVTGTDGARYPCRHPPIASATAMRVTAIRTQLQRKRQDRSVRRAEKLRCRAGLLRLPDLTRNSERSGDRRRRLGRKEPDKRAKLGELAVKWQATWGMSGEGD